MWNWENIKNRLLEIDYTLEKQELIYSTNHLLKTEKLQNFKP